MDSNLGPSSLLSATLPSVLSLPKRLGNTGIELLMTLANKLDLSTYSQLTLVPRPICRDFSMILKINLAAIFPSKS